MKLTIKEIKEKCEQDDKITFPGKVKIVFPVNVLAEDKVTKYAKARQNVIIKDDTGEIKVIITFKELGNDYSKAIEGKDVEVSGKVSIYNDEKNIFGKLTFAEGDEPKKATTNVSNQIRPATSALPPVIEVRKASLELAMGFWTARIGEKMEEKKIIETANKFYIYLTGKAEKVSGQKKETNKKEEKEKAEIEKEGKDIVEEEKLSAEKIILINSAMKLKEEHHLDTETFAEYCNGKDIKELTIEELKKLESKLKEITGEIPF